MATAMADVGMPTSPSTPPPTKRQLVREIVNVIEQLPGPQLCRSTAAGTSVWGATQHEVASSMPGDELVTGAQYRATRAITIAVPPDAVSAVAGASGWHRAGWYSNDLLDNLTLLSSETVIPELQDLHVGQWVPMSPTPSDKTAFKVARFEPNRLLGVAAAGEHLGVDARTDLRRGDSSRHSTPDPLRLAPPGRGVALADPQRVRRLPDDAANAAGHQGPRGVAQARIVTS